MRKEDFSYQLDRELWQLGYDARKSGRKYTADNLPARIEDPALRPWLAGWAAAEE